MEGFSSKKYVLEIQNVEWFDQIVECIGDAFVPCSLISTFENLNIARNFTNGWRCGKTKLKFKNLKNYF